MLDAPVLKETLAATQADLTVMASSHVYDAIIRRAPGFVDRAAFRQVRYQVKEAKITSWMYLAGAARKGTPRGGTTRGLDGRRAG